MSHHEESVDDAVDEDRDPNARVVLDERHDRKDDT